MMNPVFWDFFENKSRVRISFGGSGSGKCFGRGTKVILFSGKLKNVEDIVSGDILMGPDSTPRKVLETHSGFGKLYKVKQNKGIDYIVNENHILTLKKSESCKKDRGEKTLSGSFRRPNGRYSSYEDIINIEIKEYLSKSKRWKTNFRGYRSKIKFKNKKIHLDPYFLGIWLGDGSAKGPQITTEDKEIEDFIYSFAKKNNASVSIDYKNNRNTKTFKLVYGDRFYFGPNKILNLLRKYNLIKNKHIPESYLYNSRKNRLALLAGLIDTDGSLQKNCYDFIQKNKTLTEQIKFLCNSLGFRCEIQKTKKSCMVNGKKFTGTYYRMNISGNVQEIPVKIERKKIKKFSKNKNPMITGISVENYGEGKYFGFEVDGDNLFLLEDCTVVHNSVQEFQEAIYKILVEPGHNYLVCRKVAATNKSSTYALLVQLISQMNLSSFFAINKTDMTFTVKATKYMIVLKGLDNIEKIKSFTFPEGILTDIIIEEASEISQKDFDQLNARLRGIRIGQQAKIIFQLTLLLNPIINTHWIKREFIDKKSYQRDKIREDGTVIKGISVYIIKTTYLDNKFIDDDYKTVLEGYKEIDYEFYRVYCLGEWGAFGNIIFDNWSFGTCPYSENDFDAIYCGLDFGFVHPQVIVKIGFKDGVMYSYNELCAFEKTNKEVIEMNEEFNVLGKPQQVICDSAEPSKIKEWVQSGYAAIPAIKGKDSVTRGIDFIKTQKWIIDDTKCPRTAQEVQTYHWKENKDGQPTDKPVDLFDDAIKASMYALEPLSRMKGKPSILSGSLSDAKKSLIELKKEERRKRRDVIKAQIKKNKENKV